jgi:condensin complex subunit 3
LQEEQEEEDGEDTYANDPIVRTYLDLLVVEKNKDVRKMLVGSVATSESTLRIIIDRTRDVNEEVRRVAFIVLSAKVEMRCLTIAQRAIVLKRGLADRDVKARAACADLLTAWLCACGSDVVELLRALDVETNEDVAETVLRELVASGALRPMEWAKTKAAEGLRREVKDNLMDAETAMLWRAVCEYLHAAAASKSASAASGCGSMAAVTAAEASEQHEALEDTLPDSVTAFFDLVDAHVAGGVEHQFAAKQLLRLVPVLDLADGVGANAASALLEKVLGAAPDAGSYALGGDETWERAVVAAAKHVYATPRHMQETLINSALALSTQVTYKEPLLHNVEHIFSIYSAYIEPILSAY